MSFERCGFSHMRMIHRLVSYEPGQGRFQAATTARYTHLASDPVKAAAAAVAGKIATAMAGGSGDAGKGHATVLPPHSGA